MTEARDHLSPTALFHQGSEVCRRDCGWSSGTVPGGPVFAIKTVVPAMQIITILNRCHRFRRFFYEGTKLTPTERNTVEVHFRSGKGSAAICSGCHRPAAGYDYPAERHTQLILLSGFRVFLVCGMRWVNCQTCGAVVEETLRARRPS